MWSFGMLLYELAMSKHYFYQKLEGQVEAEVC